MIDTVKMFFPHARRKHVPAHWKVTAITETKTVDDGTECDFKKCVYIDKETGLRASGDENEIRFVEVSLPRLLYGTNAKLIKSQTDINNALWLVRRKLNEIGVRQTADFYFTRVDLVWQVNGELRRLGDEVACRSAAEILHCAH